MAKSIYLCYFGLNEPLVQTQVIPYLLEIAEGGVKVSLLTYEVDPGRNWTAERIHGAKSKLAEKGIFWHCLTYHKWPSIPATLFDLFSGLRHVIRLNRTESFDVIHARGHIPAPIAALMKVLYGTKFLFDIRGFMPEEYADAGVWKANGVLFTTVKRVEKWLMSKADGFVVLTERAREILFPESTESGFDKLGRPVEVIPCCVDLERLIAGQSAADTRENRLPDADGKKVIVYVGSFGGWYMTDEMLDMFNHARRGGDSSFALILTQRGVDGIVDGLVKRGFAKSDFMVATVPPSEIFGYLELADLAISFIRPCYSKLSSSPTKIAEYLAAGVPVICNSGVGDIDAMVRDNRVGVIIDGFKDADYVRALNELDKLYADGDLRQRCRDTAKRLFDLESVGGVRYRRIYKALMN